MSITRHHNEWLSLVPNSGPFLSLPVLGQAFPQGLHAHDADHARRLRQAFSEWDDQRDPAIHRLWIQFVLAETLGYDELLAEGQAIPQTLKSEAAEYGETLRPDWIVNDPATGKARVLVQVYPRSQALTKPVASSRWKTSPDTRMMQLLHDVEIQALDKADQEHGRKLLADVDEKVLYESALTVMMRLVFLFCAEERELLLLGDDLYDKNYAVSTLREQLRVTADQFGEEILGLRYDAWARLLTTFRAVYAGARHDRLHLPAYVGSLFNPDRFPFLEGRQAGTRWRDVQATPLPVSNRTVLHLLEALQVLQVRLPGGGTAEARKLSFRSLDIEQVGHVYEGLLDHTAKRAMQPVLGLAGTRDKEPEIALAELENLAARGEKELLKFLKDKTGRSESALRKGLKAELDDQLVSRFRTACQDSELWKRVQPFAGLVRRDTVDYPVVITVGSVFVTGGTDRRSSGTHYTPRSLTEPIVQYTLEPLVYVGPAEGLPKDQWKLRSARELLDLKICDMACGSGAFLVQACRYLSARLLEAWAADEESAQRLPQQPLFGSAGQSRPEIETVRITPYGQPSKGGFYEQLVSLDPDERQSYALRLVAQRCLYGVDKNPLAAEMAKLSLWLLTLAKDKPFEFLDHAIRCGDSLVGIHNLDQLRRFNLDGKGEDNRLFLGFLDDKIKEAIALRHQIAEMLGELEQLRTVRRLIRDAEAALCRYGRVAIGECSYVQTRVEHIDNELMGRQRTSLPTVSEREQAAAWVAEQAGRQRSVVGRLQQRLETMTEEKTALVDRRRSLSEQSRRIPLLLDEIRDWHAFLEGTKPNSAIQSLEQERSNTETNIASAKVRLTGLITDQADRVKLFESRFDRVVKQTLTKDFTGVVEVEEEGIDFRIKRGESLFGEAYETLAVLLADVALLFESKATHVHHPGLLLHDSPREADLNPRIYQRLLDMADAHMREFERNGDMPYQYIVTTTTPPSQELQNKSVTKIKLTAGLGALFRRQLETAKPATTGSGLFDPSTIAGPTLYQDEEGP